MANREQRSNKEKKKKPKKHAPPATIPGAFINPPKTQEPIKTKP